MKFSLLQGLAYAPSMARSSTDFCACAIHFCNARAQTRTVKASQITHSLACPLAPLCHARASTHSSPINISLGQVQALGAGIAAPLTLLTGRLVNGAAAQKRGKGVAWRKWIGAIAIAMGSGTFWNIGNGASIIATQKVRCQASRCDRAVAHHQVHI